MGKMVARCLGRVNNETGERRSRDTPKVRAVTAKSVLPASSHLSAAIRPLRQSNLRRRQTHLSRQSRPIIRNPRHATGPIRRRSPLQRRPHPRKKSRSPAGFLAERRQPIAGA